MEERYSRNRLYVSESEQKIIKDYRILLGGAGMGSVVAECALRFGFEHLTIIDNGKIEISDLNRQNYTEKNIGRNKAKCLAERLLLINPNAHIEYNSVSLDSENIETLLNGHNVAVNSWDCKDNTPFLFDEICKKLNIPVLHPYNLGWAGFVTVVDPSGHSISELSEEQYDFERKVAEYVVGHCAFWNRPKVWLDNIITRYKEEDEKQGLPQLAIASWIAAGLCTTAIYHLATGKELNYFPKYYLSSLMQ